MTFQGHSELTTEIVLDLLETDNGSYGKTSNLGLKAVTDEHDGEIAWKRVMEWAATK